MGSLDCYQNNPHEELKALPTSRESINMITLKRSIPHHPLYVPLPLKLSRPPSSTQIKTLKTKSRVYPWTSNQDVVSTVLRRDGRFVPTDTRRSRHSATDRGHRGRSRRYGRRICKSCPGDRLRLEESWTAASGRPLREDLVISRGPVIVCVHGAVLDRR